MGLISATLTYPDGLTVREAFISTPVAADRSEGMACFEPGLSLVFLCALQLLLDPPGARNVR